MSIRRRMIIANQLKLKLKFNQLVQNGNFETTDYWAQPYSATLTVENNIGITTPFRSASTSEYGISQTLATPVIGNKYYETMTVKNSLGCIDCAIYQYGGNAIWGDRIWSDWITRKAVFTASSTRNNVNIYCGLNKSPSVIGYIKNVMIIDLTAMYGAGNEPTTTAQVEADCLAIGHDLSQYQAYTPIT